MDSKAEYSALSSTRSQKKKLKQRQCPFNTVGLHNEVDGMKKGVDSKGEADDSYHGAGGAGRGGLLLASWRLVGGARRE